MTYLDLAKQADSLRAGHKAAANQGCNEGGTIPRAPNHYGGAEALRVVSNDCGGAESLKNVTSTFFNAVICFRKNSRSNMVAPNLLLAPGAI